MNRGKFVVKSLLLLFFIFSQVSIASATTTSGVLTDNEIWSGKVYITGDVVVPEGITLTIKANTVINFTPDKSDYDVKIPVVSGLGADKCNLVIEGNLIVQGDKNKRVVLGSEDKLSWGGIVFKGANIDSIVGYARIMNADIGILCVDSSFVKLIGNEIVKNDVGVMIFGLSSAKLKSNKIQNNYLCGITSGGYSRSTITENIISGNGIGILFEDSSNPLIFDNKLRENLKDIQDNREKGEKND